MHFLGASATHHAHNLFAGGSAHDGVVNQHHALTFEQAAHRIQLKSYAEVAHRLLWLDEGAAYVVIANEAEPKRDATFRSVTHRGGYTGVRYRHNQVGIGRGFDGKLAAEFFAALLHRASKAATVGTRKINMLE